MAITEAGISEAAQRSQEMALGQAQPSCAAPGPLKATVLQFGCKQRDHETAEACQEMIAAAMLEDPAVLYFARSAVKHRLAMWKEMVCLNYAAARSYSEPPLFYCTEDGKCAALCFMHPEQEVSLWQYIRHGGLKMLVRHLRPRRWLSALKHQAALDREQAQFGRENGAYLHVFLVATNANFRSQGLGSQVLQRISQEADARGVSAYLETTTERARALYLRHGYKDTSCCARSLTSQRHRCIG